MGKPVYKARSYSGGAPARLFEIEPDDPYPYAWRERWQIGRPFAERGTDL
jgi:hypothetical protein